MSKTATITEIIDYLKTSFVHTDNIEVDYSVSKQIVMEATASLAIEANYDNFQFRRGLVKAKAKTSTDKQDMYALSPEIKYHYSTPTELYKKFGKYSLPFLFSGVYSRWYCFRSFVVDKNTYPYTWKPYLAEDYDPPVDNEPNPFDPFRVENCNIYKIIKDINYADKDMELWREDYFSIRDAKTDIVNHFERKYSKYELYSSISSVKTPEKVLSQFSLGNDPYVGMAEQIQKYHYDCINTTSEEDNYFLELYRNSQGTPYEIVLNSFLYDFCEKTLTHTKIGFCLEKVFCSGKYQAVFLFRDCSTSTNMAVVKCYHPDKPCKFFVPVTAWIADDSKSIPILAATTCVPHPGKQPLFNLDLIATEEAKTVIITDSLDIASLNQKSDELPLGLVFTSFICHEDNYEQVDWSPLIDERNKIEKLLLLVTNHSGYSLEQAYEKAKQLSEYLSTHVLDKREDLTIEYVQLEVRYDRAKYSQHFPAWITHLESTYTDDPMQSLLVDSESVMHLDCAEFEDMYARSQITPKRFWEDEDTEDESLLSTESQQVKQKADPIRYLMRPLIVRGKTTMIYGPKASGKSLLSQSIAMAIVNASAERPIPIFQEQWWRVNKPTKSDIAKGYRYRKVLYLNFELGSEMDTREKQFAKSLWGKKVQECKNNMIIVDMSEKKYSGVDFSLPENHQKVYQLLDDAKSQGVKDQPVDLLVIDTYTEFVKFEKESTPKNFRQLCADLYNRDKNLSILVVHHANRSKDPTGSQLKTFGMYTIFQIDKIEDANGILTPRKYLYAYSNNPDKVTNFTGKLKEDHTWVVDSIDGYDKPDGTKMLKEICKQYEVLGYGQLDMATMLGISENTLRKYLKA